MTPDVSVIVPVYNVEKYLSRCVKSIMNQKIENIEILLVNDGSTDSSGELCDKFAELDNRIKVIHKKNGGLSDARNAGLDIAKGKFIGFIDSDDYVHPEMYKVLLEVITNNDCDIAECGFKEVFSEEAEVNNYINSIGSGKIYLRKQALLSSIMDHHCRTYVWNKLYKRELWEKIRFPYGKIYEDVFTTHKVINEATKLIKVEQVLYYYFQRDGSIVNSKFSTKKMDHHEALDEMMLFIEKNHPDLAPLTCVKYFSQSLPLLQELLINRKEINNYKIIVERLSEDLTAKKYNKYLRTNTKLVYKQFIGKDYNIFLVKKLLIKLRLTFLKRSVWLLYLFNNTIKNMKNFKRILSVQKGN
ncbi:glycosyltransferase [Priestia megaterium]|uniref:glycosyltransferase n=1 Tax=Priestia megaterium TaxID=1404 RepID=UPI001C468D0F|nr:glycosyltransferase [Priestia megaterium]MBV6736454.1 glycosyltransferase [Priestia megaterium]MDR0127786.1 glycosyltransferase [Priestia megaterium]